MAIGTPVERKAVSNAGLSTSTWVVAPTTTISAGTVAILCFTSGANKGISSISDAAGNTWTVDNSGGDGTRKWVFASCQVTTAITTSTNITITLSNTTNSEANLWIQEVSGLATSAVADKNTSGSGTGTNPSSGNCGTLSQADEIGFGLFRTATSTSWTKSSSYSNPTTPTLGSTSALEYIIVSATNGIQATGNFGASASWIAAIQTYKAAAAGVITINAAAASATATGGVAVPVEVLVADLAAATAAGLVPVQEILIAPGVVTATATALVPVASTGGGTLLIVAPVASARAAATIGFGQGGFGEGLFGGDGPVPVITMLPGVVTATATGLAPSVTSGSLLVVATVATASASALAAILGAGTNVTVPVASAAASAPVPAPLVTIVSPVASATGAGLGGIVLTVTATPVTATAIVTALAPVINTGAPAASYVPQIIIH
jgi:hypothetical protein